MLKFNRKKESNGNIYLSKSSRDEEIFNGNQIDILEKQTKKQAVSALI